MSIIKETHAFDTKFGLLFIANETGTGISPYPVCLLESDLHKEKMTNKTYAHFHEGYEMVYVHQGEGTFLIDNQIYSMQAGDVFLIRPDIIHHPSPSDTNGYHCSVILLKPQWLAQISTLNAIFLACFNHPTSQISWEASSAKVQFETLLSYLKQELDERLTAYQEVCLNYLKQLLILVSRRQQAIVSYTVKESLSVSEKTQNWMNAILHHLDETYLTHPTSLQVLAEQALVTPEHFSRVFKKVTGMTLPSYVNLKKMHYAKTLLTTTSLPIQQISEMSGFNDVSYFIRKFKAIWGCQPSDVRRVISQ